MTNDYYNLNRYYNTNKYYNLGKYYNLDKYYTKSPVTYKPGEAPADAVNKLAQAFKTNYLPIENNRGMLDRFLDSTMVFNYAIAGGIKGGIKGTGVLPGIVGGIRAGNPFGKGYEKGEVTFSDVLESGGWRPEGIGGKIAKGGVGLTLDILLDPLTYLSGGLSAFVKGTGKTGLKVTHASAIKKFADDFGVDVSKGLSEADAKKVILKQAFKHNRVVADDEVEKGAKLFSKEFNKVIGIQPEVRDLTWSLKNGLFGEKLFPKAKVYTLANAEELQGIGDKTLAPLYSTLRNKFYGGKLGEKFSTITPLYKLSKTDPEAFYDFVRKIEADRGLYGDKVKRDYFISKHAKEFADLTPAENKQLLELMQDPSKWHYVTDTFNYLDTKSGQRRYAKLAVKNQKDIERLERLKSQREYLENAKKHSEELKDAAVENLAKLEDEVRDELLAIDLKQINDEKTKKEYIKLINEEIVKLKGQKAEITSKAAASSADESKLALDIKIKESEERLAELTTEGEKISKTIKELGKQEDADLQSLYKRMSEIKSEIKALKTNIHKPIIDAYEVSQNLATQRKQLSKFFKMVEEKVSKEELIKHIEENKDLFDKVAKERLDDIINSGKITYAQKQELYGVAAFNKKAFCEQLSQHLGGVDDLIKPSTYDNHIDTLIKLMKDGVSNEDMLKFIDDNRRWFDGTASFMYDFIAGQLGYKVWREAYDEPLKQILDVIRKTGKVTAKQQKMLNDLEALKAKRDYWIQVLAGKSIDEMKPIMQEYVNRKLLEDVLPIIESKKTKKALEKYESINPKPEDYTRIMEGIVENEGKKRFGEIYNTKFTAYERDEVYSYLIEYYTKLGVKNFGRGHNIMFNKIIDEVQEIVTTNKWFDEFGEKTKIIDWLNLTDKQKDMVVEWAINNYNRGFSTKVANNNKVKDAFVKEILNRQEENRIKHIVNEVCSSDTVDVKLGGRDSNTQLTTVRVTDYELTKRGEILYHAVNAYGQKIYFNPEDVVNIYTRNAPKTIDELVVSSEITKKTINRADELFEEYKALEKEAQFTKNLYSALKAGKDENYKKITDEITEANRVLANRKATLQHLEKQGVEKTNMQKSMIEAIERQIAEKEKDIFKLKTNLKTYTQGQLRKVDRLEREFAERSSKIAKEIEDYEAKVFAFEKNLDSAKFNTIDKLAKDIENASAALDSKEAFDTYMRSILGDKHVDKAVLMDKMDVVEVALNDEVEVNEKVRQLANFLRSQMVEWGREEVTIGKLREKQLKAHMLDYLPHIATSDGERLFGKLSLEEGVKGFGQDYGYGKHSFNPYGKSRTMVINKGEGELITNPTIEEINAFWSDELKGRNVFSETISEIYLTRGLKHNELMYDDNYMRNMLDMFGYDLPFDGVLKEGYKPVMNFGMLRDTLKHMSNLHVKTEISNDVHRYLSNPELIEGVRAEVVQDISKLNIVSRKEYNFTYKKIFGEKMSAISKEYIKKNYSLEKLSKMFEDYLEFNTKSGKVASSIEDVATPLLEMTNEQISAMQHTYNYAVDSYLETIKRSVISIAKSHLYSQQLTPKVSAEYLNSLRKRIETMNAEELQDFLQKRFNNLDELDAARLNSVYKKLDSITSHPLQIKQVNEAIVEKANRMRKIQLLKDNHDMLVLWDKVTHFIKLNQTTVVPAFHMRNKFSNTFNNWLLIGKDAVDLELQKASAKTIYHRRIKNDKEAIRHLTIDINGVETSWNDLYDLAMQYGVIDNVFFLQDLGTGFSHGALGRWLKPEHDPTDAKNFIWYKKGAKVGSAIEGQDRLLNFVACLRNGKTPEEAAESSIKALFDYSDITAFERNVMKRIIPYYTWLRKNAPYQLEMMLEDPKKFYYISKIMHGVEGMNNEEDQINRAFVNEFAKDWVQTPFTVKNPHGREEVVMWNPNLPFMDLGRIPDPFNFTQSMIGMFNQMNPMIRVPIEQAMNYNAFFESPIVGEDESQLNRAKHVFNNMALYNVGRGFVQKSGMDKALHALNATTGLKFLSYDYDAYKAMKLDELRKKYDNPQAQIELAGKVTAGDVLGLVYKGLVEGFEDSFSKAVDTVGDKVMSSRPMKADEYTDALRPISQAKYERLSDEEKEKYTPPTEKQAIAYHKKAVELEQEQLAKSGTAKKYIWSLFERMHVGERNKEYALGEVVKVTDGDTFNVKIGDEVKTVRMLLIDTPESVKGGVIEQPLAMRASEYAKKSLLGKDTKIVFDVEKIDNYNRVLGYVEVDGVDFNEKLLKEGLAKVGYIYKSKNRLDKYRNAEKEAFDINKGIWSVPGYVEPGGKGYYQTYYDEAIVRKLNSMAN